MAELERKMARLKATFASPWSETRQRGVERDLLREQQRRLRAGRAARVALAACLVVGLLGVVGWRIAPRLVHGPSAVQATPPTAGRLVLSDESTVTPGPDTDVRWAEVTPSRVTAVLRRGRAQFDVFHAERRVFRVEAGDVAVQALGTVFDVERVDAERSRVSVSRGKVRVFWADATRDLSPGEEGVFPPAASTPASTPGQRGSPAPGGVSAAGPVAEGTADTPAPAPSSARPPSSLAPSWHALARSGAFEEAYEALGHEGAGVVRGDVGELLLASDVARLSHHPADAVAPLREILVASAGDPRAPLAAFTLGRVYLESLGQPHEAALAFAEARRLAPDGDLAPDALAREVEACAASGDSDAARTRGLEYVTRYPAGPRLRAVKRQAGLE